MIAHIPSMGVRWIFPGFREIMDFFIEWPKKIFQGDNIGET